MSNLFKTTAHPRVLSSHRKVIEEIISTFPTQFERKRQFGPLQVILTLAASHFGLSSGQGQSWTEALGDVAREFGVALEWEPEKTFSKNSFHVARRKVTEEMLTDLWDTTIRILGKGLNTDPLVYIQGLRFLHVDGSQFGVQNSPELVREFGVQTNGKNKQCYYPTGQLVTVIEGGSGALLGTHITRCKKKDTESQSSLTMGERSGLEELMYLQGENDCFVGDAGFLSYRLMYDMSQKKRYYLMGAGKGWKFVQKFLRARKADEEITITVPLTHPDKELRGKEIHLRILTIQGSEGSKKCIVTNIMKEKLSRSDVRKVYKQRWSIEIFFRHTKEYLGMRHLRSRTLDGVKQEIFAIMLMMRITAFVQSTVTCAINKIYNTLDIFTKGFKKTRMLMTLKHTWMIMKQSFGEVTEKEEKSLLISWSDLLRNMQIYIPGRKHERVSRALVPNYKEKRPDRSKRKQRKTQGKGSK